jgi:hypothetical protein
VFVGICAGAFHNIVTLSGITRTNVENLHYTNAGNNKVSNQIVLLNSLATNSMPLLFVRRQTCCFAWVASVARHMSWTAFHTIHTFPNLTT